MARPYYEVYEAAIDVINALSRVGEPWSCFIGGMAAKLHGVNRVVKDLDIVVLQPDMDEEELQDALVEYDPRHFYLKPPRQRNAGFLKLYYIIPSSGYSIKVDLLLSTIDSVEIPSTFHPNHFEYINNLPVAPLYFVLYHKLFGWSDRVDHPLGYKREQAHNKDYPDIIRLCTIMRLQEIYPLNKVHMGRMYLTRYQARAEELADAYNDNGNARMKLRRIGFDV